MCGLFGFRGRRADPALLELAAVHAARRGPDGWGFYAEVPGPGGARNGRGARAWARYVGPFDHSAMPFSGRPRLLIGHSRLATSGPGGAVEDLQPLRAGGTWGTHNGVTPSRIRTAAFHLQARANLAVDPVLPGDSARGGRPFGFATRNDSEALVILAGATFASCDDSPARLARTVVLWFGATPFAFVLHHEASDATVLAASAMPLFVRTAPEGVYWSSVQPGDDWLPLEPGVPLCLL